MLRTIPVILPTPHCPVPYTAGEATASFSSSPPSLLHAADPRPSSPLPSPALPQHGPRSKAPASALPFPLAPADPSPFARCYPSPRSAGPRPRALTATAALAPRAETAAAGRHGSRPPPLTPRAPTCACASPAAPMRARRPSTVVRGHLQPRPASATATPRLAAPRPCRCQVRPPSPRAPAPHARPPSSASIAPLRPPRAALPPASAPSSPGRATARCSRPPA
nr:vegetative cell wall protein gp1-like [Aegilops tauschii subsp. strangulata]